jgi:hypothetical protein|tara:strand:- start:170 stop:430 length:261 start_codon:yes stop_codon:yes gene_type:complete
MRELKTKQVRKLSKEFVVEWLQSMLTEEEQKKVSVDNYEKYLPEDRHFYANNKLMVSAYTPRWFAQRIKKVLRTKHIDDITYSDVI